MNNVGQTDFKVFLLYLGIIISSIFYWFPGIINRFVKEFDV